jgi:hypothetical protein
MINHVLKRSIKIQLDESSINLLELTNAINKGMNEYNHQTK